MLRVSGLHFFERFGLDERLQIPATFDQTIEYDCQWAPIRLHERLWFAEATPVHAKAGRVEVRPGSMCPLVHPIAHGMGHREHQSCAGTGYPSEFFKHRKQVRDVVEGQGTHDLVE